MQTAIMDNRLSSSGSTLASELAIRRAKGQSYFDRYPERKGQGPIVPSATLILPQAKSSVGSSSRASSSSSSSTSRTSFDQQSTVSAKFAVAYTQETPRQHSAAVRALASTNIEAYERDCDDGLSRHWHTRKEERRVRGADAKHGEASTSSSLTPLPQSYTTGLPASFPSSSQKAPQTRVSPLAADTALETYRVKAAAASGARSSIAPGHAGVARDDSNASPLSSQSRVSPLPGKVNSPTPAQEAPGWNCQPQHPKNTPVLSINDIIRKHAPDALSSSPQVKKGLCANRASVSHERNSTGKGPASSSSFRATTESLQQDDQSDSSSIGSVEREIRRVASIEPVLAARSIPSSSVSPALQAALLRPTQPTDVRRNSDFSRLSVAESPSIKLHQTLYTDQNRLPPPVTPSKLTQYITPSVSAPVLSQKKSIPKLFLSPRRRQSHRKSDSLSDESALSGGADMSRSSSASLAKSATESSFSTGLYAKEHSPQLTRAKSTFDLRGPQRAPASKMSLPSSANTRDATAFPPVPLTPPYLRHSKSPSPISAASDYSNDESANDVRRYVQSAELTQLMTLTRAPYEGKTVSIADVGDPNGQVVVVFLGLGAVRYLIGLYTEMAVALNVRLICVDRWGMGKTDDMPSELRGVLEWSNVIAEVADRLCISRFSIMAHSAGAPYAMATALVHAERIIGPVHLLAPWVSPALESGYKWLRYVPDGVIRTAQAAEWRVQGWKLGASSTPKSATESPAATFAGDLSNESEEGRRYVRQASETSQRSASGIHLALVGDESFDSDTSQHNGVRSASPSPSLTGRRGSNVNKTRAVKGPISALQKQHTRAPSEDTLSGLAEHADMLYAWQRAETFPFAEISDVPPCTPAKDRKVPTPMHRRPGQKTSIDPPLRGQQAWNASALSSADLPTALLRASHAESGGSTNDLLVILGRASQKPWGFTYTDVRHAVRVWHGDKDERVGVASVLWMEREMFDCQLTLVKGANHGLMTNVAVVVEVLESIAAHRFA